SRIWPGSSAPSGRLIRYVAASAPLVAVGNRRSLPRIPARSLRASDPEFQVRVFGLYWPFAHGQGLLAHLRRRGHGPPGRRGSTVLLLPPPKPRGCGLLQR